MREFTQTGFSSKQLVSPQRAFHEGHEIDLKPLWLIEHC